MTYGLMVLAINLGYLLFAVVAGIILSKMLKKLPLFQKLSSTLLATLLILGIALAPFYDLLIQKGIKTYYQLFDKTYAEIYAYPEKDDEGRVESLGADREYKERLVDYLNDDDGRKSFKQQYLYIKNFSENYFHTFGYKKKDLGYARVYLNKDVLNYEKITSPKEFKARYQILTEVNQHCFYKEMITSFWDKKKNTILAKTVEVAFPVKNEKEKFRYKYLHQHGANGGRGISLKGIYGLKKDVYKKLFIKDKKGIKQ